MRRRFRRLTRKPAEMNITAFMNLMVILVPFLLITAVFSRVTILELNLPPSASAKTKPEVELQLEITIRDDALIVGERHTGVIQRIAKDSKGYDYTALSKVLQRIKSRFPDKQNATILSEPDTAYETLVQVMDAVRLAEVVQQGALTKVELFPDISIGDAPSGSRSSQRKAS
jgi:biopolymer transport protein ExbD